MSRSTSPENCVQGCVTHVELFQHPLVEEPPTESAPGGVRRQYTELLSRARAVCHDCPIRQQCLYDAVVKHDVAGFVAGTTERERKLIRRQLDLSVPAENLDTLAGAFRGGRRIDHAEIVRLRQANPHESLEALARRLDCSLSTVKRHLRRHRRAQDGEPKRPAPSVSDVVRAAGGKGTCRDVDVAC